MSFTAVFLPILAALNFAQTKVLPDLSWTLPQNNEQKTFVDFYVSRSQEFLSKVNNKEISGIASWNHLEINRFVAQHGFNIRLEELSTDEFGVAAILNVLVKWKKPGERSVIERDNQKYSAVKLKKGYVILESTKYDKPILKIETETDDKVFITIANKPLDSFDLLNFVKILETNEAKAITDDYNDAIFPMVDLNHETDISWLIGMRGSDNSNAPEVQITQAKQQTKFQMNEEGAAAQSAAAISCTRGGSISFDPDFIIDQPFYLWIKRPGLDVPLFAAYIDTADWKEPAKLG